MQGKYRIPKRIYNAKIRKNQKYWDQRGPQYTWYWYNKNEEELQKFLKTYDQYLKNLDVSVMELLRSGSKPEDIPGSKGYQMFLKKVQSQLNNMSKEEINYLQRALINNMQGVTVDTNKLLGIDFNLPNQELQDLLNTPWVNDGKNFSERIWHNKADLVDALDNAVKTGISEGASVDVIARAMQKYIKDVPMSRMIVLARTETMHFLNVAQFNSYAKAGVTKVGVLVAQDERLCPTCDRAGKEGPYTLDKAPGLPLHAQCRCCYVPIVDSMIEPKEDPVEEIKKPKDVEPKKKVSKKPDTIKKPQKVENPYKSTLNELRTSLKENPNREKIAKEVEKRIKDSSPIAKAMFEKMDKNFSIANAFNKDGAYYSPSNKSIYLDLVNDFKNYHRDRGRLTTLFHEWGHLIDDNALEGKAKLSHDKKYIEALKKDYDDLIKKAKKIIKEKYPSYGEDNNQMIAVVLSKSLGIEGKGTNGIQDVISGFSKDDIRIKWGHDKDYWNRGNGDREVSSEAFAHMTAAITNPEIAEKMNKYLPRAYERYLNIIEDTFLPGF